MSLPLGYLGGIASTTTFGQVELATVAETVAGASTTKVCTPAGVAAVAIAGAPSASTTVSGILKTTTNGDAVAGVLTNTAIVPSNLASVFAAPPAIGGTTPAAGTFTTLTATTLVFASALDVSEGGTGLSTITDHGVMLGSGTGAVTPTAVGATNQIFIGQTGADPIWSNNIDVPGTLDVTGAAVFDSTVNVVGTLTAAAITNSGLISGTAGITVTGAAINLGTDAGAFAVNLGTGAAAKTITVGNSTGATQIVLNSGTAGINIGTNAIAQPITIGNSTGATAILLNSGTGGVGVGTNAVAQTVTIGNVTGATAVAINSGTGHITLTSTGTGDIIANSADTLLLDAAGVLELNSSAGVIGIGNDAVAQNINIGTGAAARVITIGNVTGASQVVLNSGTAGVAINTTGAGDVVVTSADTVLIDAAGVLELNSSAGVIGIGNDAVAQNINVGTGAAARVITIGNVTGATQVVLNSGTAGVAINTTGAGDVVVTSADTVLIDGAGVVELNSSAGAISIGNDAVAQAINIGTGAAARTITVGNSTGATAVVIDSGSGAVTCNKNFILGAVATQFQMNGGAVTDFIGQAVLVGGTKTVSNTNIAATDRILLSRSTLGGTPGHLSFVINPGADFVITSSSGTDTSTIDYVIIRQN